MVTPRKRLETEALSIMVVEVACVPVIGSGTLMQRCFVCSNSTMIISLCSVRMLRANIYDPIFYLPSFFDRMSQ